MGRSRRVPPIASRARCRCTSSQRTGVEGGGRLLYSALLERLAGRGYRVAAAGMTQPNEASDRLHAAMGFEPVGTFRSVGWKLDRWHDVAWVQRSLGEPGAAAGIPAEPH